MISSILEFFSSAHIISMIENLGLVGVTLIVFAESGLMVGFFLPGDSLLFTAGLLASQGHLNIIELIIAVVLAAILGDSVGYWFGSYIGPKLFNKPDSTFFKQRYVDETRAYFDKYGAQTIIIARFIPVVRTFAPILAGIGRMRYGVFIRYNIIGGILWGAGIPLAGYWLGNSIPDIDRYILPIVGLIILISALPPLWHWYKNKR